MPEPQGLHAFLGKSATAQVIRSYDWRGNPLGPIDDWSYALRTIISNILESAFPQCLVWGPQHITLYNDAFLPILGRKAPAIGRCFDEVWAEAWDIIGPMVARAYAGQPTFIEDFPLVVQRDGRPEQTYFTFCYSPVRDDDGRIAGMLDTVVETTAKVEAERQAKLLNAELAHRIQNTLTVVTSIADQTFRSATCMSEARTALSSRLKALGQAQDLLTRHDWNSASMAEVVEGALLPHTSTPGEICAQGPPVNLSPKQALSLTMAIHELATNSMKYGALAVAGGEVTIRWKFLPLHGEEYLQLCWVESGGPTVVSPERRGFGSRLIEQVLADDFRGSVTVTYEPRGLRCELLTKRYNVGPNRAAAANE
jgi:two-component sensor histidine kinase